MKRLMLALMLAPAASFAQNKNSIYVDVALNTPGGSLTYDRGLTRHFALGGGLSMYDWNTRRINVRTAVYVDLRPNWRFGRSNIFIPIDLGWAFYGDTRPANDPLDFSTNGFYTSLGVGYCYRLTRRGGGPYITYTAKGYSHMESGYDWLNRKYEDGVYDATGMLSLGFRF